jgi:hypothetical protein
MDIVPKPWNRTTRFDLVQGQVPTLSAVVNDRQITIAPLLVEVTEWPDGHVTAWVRGQVIRRDGIPGRRDRSVGYHVAGPQQQWDHTPPVSSGPAWLQQITDAVLAGEAFPPRTAPATSQDQPLRWVWIEAPGLAPAWYASRGTDAVYGAVRVWWDGLIVGWRWSEVGGNTHGPELTREAAQAAAWASFLAWEAVQ